MVEIHYRLPEQEEVDGASCLQGLVLMGDFKHPIICWRENTAGHKQARKLLDSVDDNFLTQVVEEPTRGDGPHAYKQGRTGQECEGWRQPWLQ